MIRLAASVLVLLISVSAHPAPRVAIVGGDDVSADDIVARSTVLVRGKLLRSSFTCTGTIIGEDLVLTAGHCLGAPGYAELTVYFRIDRDGAGPAIPVRAQVRPDDYNTRDHFNPWNDVALLRLSQKVPSGYQPVPLLEDPSQLADGAPVLLAGYGISVPVSSNPSNEGEGRLRKVRQKIVQAHYNPTEMLVDIHGHGPCFGDSGGPAYFETPQGLVLAGVVSHLTESDKLPKEFGPRTAAADRYGCLVDMAYSREIGRAHV